MVLSIYKKVILKYSKSGAIAFKYSYSYCKQIRPVFSNLRWEGGGGGVNRLTGVYFQIIKWSIETVTNVKALVWIVFWKNSYRKKAIFCVT